MSHSIAYNITFTDNNSLTLCPFKDSFSLERTEKGETLIKCKCIVTGINNEELNTLEKIEKHLTGLELNMHINNYRNELLTKSAEICKGMNYDPYTIGACEELIDYIFENYSLTRI